MNNIKTVNVLYLRTGAFDEIDNYIINAIRVVPNHHVLSVHSTETAQQEIDQDKYNQLVISPNETLLGGELESLIENAVSKSVAVIITEMPILKAKLTQESNPKLLH